jgi:polyisoprenoid-binding protein YceI
MRVLVKYTGEFIFASLVAVLPFSSWAVQYGVGPFKDTDTVSFKSTAKLEFIQGKTQHVNGWFSFNPENPNDGVKGVIRVDLRTLKTGIEKRDEHMRDNHLHTTKYPYAFFEIVSVEPIPSLANYDSAYTSKVNGNFYIHGGYRKIEAELELERKKLPSGGETIDVCAKFSLDLDKHKIPRPRALFLKLAETINVEVFFTGSSLIDVKAVELPDWPELD